VMHDALTAEVLDALAEVTENPNPHPAIIETLELEWTTDGFTELFDFDLPPYASYYLTVGPVLGGEPVTYLRDLLASYLPRQIQPAQPDALAFLLRLVAALTRSDNLDRARAIFYESLRPWMGTYARAVQTYAPPGLKRIGDLLLAVDALWRNETPPPASLPYLLRTAPEVRYPPTALDATTETSALLDYLLSPVASGLILPRCALISYARHNSLGIRPGGRRFSFESLLTASPATTLNFVGEVARTQQRWYVDITDPIADWWATKLAQTLTVVTDLATDIQEPAASTTST